LDTTLGIAVVIATLAGPLLAVLITRKIDENRQLQTRRLDIFRSLMGTRRSTLSPDRVRALNLVEIDFYGIETIQKAHTDLMANINTTTRPVPVDWGDRQQKLMTKLLFRNG
jgi:hypothetical protein